MTHREGGPHGFWPCSRIHWACKRSWYSVVLSRFLGPHRTSCWTAVGAPNPQDERIPGPDPRANSPPKSGIPNQNPTGHLTDKRPPGEHAIWRTPQPKLHAKVGKARFRVHPSGFSNRGFGDSGIRESDSRGSRGRPRHPLMKNGCGLCSITWASGKGQVFWRPAPPATTPLGFLARFGVTTILRGDLWE